MGPSLRTLRWEITVGYPGGPKQITWILKSRGEDQSCPTRRMWPIVTGCEGERKESRNVGSLKKVGTALRWQPAGKRELHPATQRNWILPTVQVSRKEPPQSLQVETDCKILNLCCFRLLSGGGNLLWLQQKPNEALLFPQRIKAKIISQKATLLHCW